MILASSNEGSLILDPFAGTFTTAAVAKRLGRKSISIELQEV
ncbi:DNA methyltransferase [Anabaena sp. WFMT]